MERVVLTLSPHFVQPTIYTLQLKNAKGVISFNQFKTSITEGRSADRYIS